MLSRRSIRIKVMQTVYAVERGAANDFYSGAKLLKKNLKETLDLFYYQLLCISEIADFSHEYLKIIQAKHIKSETKAEDFTKIDEHEFIGQLRDNSSFCEYIKNNKLKRFVDEGIIRELFRNLYENEFYKEYLHSGDVNDSSLIINLYKEVMLKSERYQSHLDENFTHYDEDNTSVKYRLIDLLEDTNALESGNFFDKLYDKGDADFAVELLDCYRENEEEYEKLIEPQLKNWDIQRIARLDVILIKLALCELLNFENIPVKVSINEYIDISKLYSTPKSHEFVNGVIDRLRKKLQKEKKIKKTGRGLLS